MAGLVGGAVYWYGPWNAEVRYRRAGLVELYRRTQGHPGDQLAWRELGLRLAGHGDGPAAEPALRQALALEPNDAEVATGLGEILLSRGETDEAFQVLRGVVGRSPEYLPARLALGRLYRRRGAYHHAASQFEAIARRSREYPDAHFELARCYLQMQQVDRAREAIAEARRLVPEEPQYLLLEASILTATGELDAAIRALQAATALAPRLQLAQSALALTLLAHTRSPTDIQLAEEAVERLSDLNAEHRLLPFLRGQVALARRRWPEAVRHLEQARETSPEQDEVYFALSRAYRAAGRAADADRELERFRRRQGLRRETDELLIRLTTTPDRPDLHVRLAEIQLEAGDTEAARRSVATAGALKPRDPPVLRRLAALKTQLRLVPPEVPERP